MIQILSETTINRLKKYAEPFVDTVDDVVNRMIDYYEQMSAEDANFNTSAHESKDNLNTKFKPNLELDHYTNISFSKFQGGILNGKLISSSLGWNGLLRAAIIEASNFYSGSQLSEVICINNRIGKKENDGFKYIKEANISFQGQNAQNAWKATLKILKTLNLPAKIEFSLKSTPQVINFFIVE